MPGGGVGVVSALDLPDRIEAPVTFKAYLMCAFASFGGIFFGYDSGYVSGVMGMNYVVSLYTGLPIPGADASAATKAAFALPSWEKSLITSILSVGTFFGALIAGDLADITGRRTTIIAGSVIFIAGVVLQTASAGLALLATGRLIAGFGVGFVSAVIILYMSEIAPRKVRGALVSGYQFCITLGLLIASCVDYATQNRLDSGSYRIPIAIQMLWPLVLSVGLLFLPESPRYFVKKGDVVKAQEALARLRGQPRDSNYVKQELAEIVANNEYEKQFNPAGDYFESWTSCFKGDVRKRASNVRRTILGTSLQMMQQLTGVNFIFYFGTTFFEELHTISNPFLISLVTTLVNVLSTPISFYTIERFGRRPIMIAGAAGMVVCQFAIAIAGSIDGTNPQVVTAMIALICAYIAFFATTWGPGAWVVIGEIFPLTIRSRGVALSTASNWLWNCLIAIITPYMVGTDQGNLGSNVFYIWGSLCTLCLIYAYFLIPETKGLTLEQVSHMMEESGARASARWVPHVVSAELTSKETPGYYHIEG